MKKFLVIIFTIVTLISPAYFCNAEGDYFTNVGTLSMCTGTDILTSSSVCLNVKELPRDTEYYLTLNKNNGPIESYHSPTYKFNVASEGYYIYDLDANTSYRAILYVEASSSENGFAPSSYLDIKTKEIGDPKIISFSPTYGMVGTEVTITGLDFYNIDSVFVSGIKAPNFTVINSKTIKVKIPSGYKTGTISVISDKNNIVKKAISSQSFTQPEIYFSPASGNVGDEITISSNSDISGTSGVIFGSVNAIPKVNNSEFYVLVNVPEGATTGKLIVKTTKYGDIVSKYDFTIGSGSEVPTITYVVVKGDTLSKIAIKFNTTVANLQKLNDIPDANVNKITVGQILIVPDTSANTTPGATTPGTTKTTTSGSSFDGKGLASECNTGEIDPATGNYVNPCTFNSAMALINKLITFVLITLATPLFALIMIYVGYLYLTASGSAENVNLAKKILKNAVFGYIIALTAWLVVKTILTTLGFQAGTEAQFFDYLK